MIEEIYNPQTNDKQTEEVKLHIPKNVRQIGEIEDLKKIYLEDYVFTFLQHLASDNIETTKIAVILGSVKRYENKSYFFISAAIELGNPVDTDGKLGFKEECWTSVYTVIKKYFDNLSIVGWFMSVPGFELTITEEVKDIHLNNFAGNDKVLMMLEPIDKDEAFFSYEGGNLRRLKGFYVYFEKNEKMQEYMVSLNSTEEKETEPDSITQSVRSILKEKKHDSHSKKVMAFMSLASTFLVMIVLIIGITLVNNYDKMKNMESSLSIISKSIRKEDNNEKYVGATESAKANEEKNEQQTSDNVAEDVPSTAAASNPATPAPTTDPAPAADPAQAQPASQAQAQPASQANAQPVESVPASNPINPAPQEKAVVQYYTVQDGDTLLGICRKIYNSSSKIKQICDLNKISNFDYIYAGQVLQLP